MFGQKLKKGDDIRDYGLTAPKDIIRYDDIVYGQDAKWQSLDVYRPRAAEGQMLPVIVSVHGGVWVYGDEERYQFYCMNLAKRGFAVGDSAGAHILSLYSCICTNFEYAQNYDFQPPVEFVPTAIALNCGVNAVSLAPSPDGTLDLIQQLMDDYLPDKGSDKELDLIHVTSHITSEFPPTFLMTCNGDFLRNQAPVLVDKLIEKDIPHVFRFYGDKDHILGHVFHCDVKSSDAMRCNDAECAFFKEFILRSDL